MMALRVTRLSTAGLRLMSSAASDEVLFETRKNVGIITLNRPKQLNALNLNMIRLIYPQLKQWETSLEMVIIRGAGEKAFCAGGDVVSVTSLGRAGDPQARQFFREEYRINNLTGSLKIPYIALQNGITMGGGCGLSVHGPYRVCTERTLFAMPETAIGLFPDVGGGYFLPRLPDRLGLFLALTGHRLKGADCLHAGISTHACETARLGQLVDDLVSGGAAALPEVLRHHTEQSAFYTDSQFSLAGQLDTIRRCFASDSVPAVLTALQQDGSESAQKLHATLLRMSPTSLVVTAEQLRRGAQLSLKDCLEMESVLTEAFLRDHDFYEGVRAMLVDKDQRPVWKPATIEELPDNVLDTYFTPAADHKPVEF